MKRIKGEDRDIVVGAVVLVTAALLFALVYGKEIHSSPGSGYTLLARFRHADGLAIGADVRLSGVVVGKVVAEDLDSDYRAVTSLRLAADVALPIDTAAAIQTDGLLGSKYLDLKPGGDDVLLKPGAEISFTQDSMMFEDLLEMIINQGRAKRGYLGKPLSSESQ